MADKYYAIFAREVGGVPVMVRRRRFNPNKAAEGISFRGSTHLIDLDRPVYRANKKFVYLIDMEKGQKVLTQSEIPVSPKLMDIIMKRNIVKQLVAGLGSATGDWKMMMLYIIIGLVMGIMTGIVLGMVFDIGGTTVIAPPTDAPVDEVVALLRR